MMLASIPSPPTNVIEIGPLTIHYYGIAIAIGALVAITLVRKRYQSFGGDPELADRAALWAVGMGFVGARVGYLIGRVIDGDVARFVERPLSIIAVWEGGLAFFGGLVFGTATGIWYIRRHGGRLDWFADAVAPALPLAQAIGRWGNYFNQELFGTPTDLPWGLEIEPHHRPVGYAEFETFHPTFLYESLWNLGLAAFLIWLGRRGRLRTGSLMFLYAAGYGVMRFLLELIRTDTTFRLFGISRNGYVALLVLAIGLGGLWWYQRRATADAEPPEADAALPVADAEPPDAVATATEGTDAAETAPAEAAIDDDVRP
jgi:prolipoprotein diacylglyceryl transferase